MNAADARARKNRTGAAADRMANAARLGALEKNLGVPVKRYRDPGGGSSSGGSFTDSENNKDAKPVRFRID